MIRDLKATFAIRKSSEIFNIVMVCTAVILAVILAIGIDDIIEMPTILVSIVASAYVGLNLFIKPFMQALDFSKGISFGMTRRKLFAYMRLFDLAEILLITIIMICFPIAVGVNVIFKVGAICFGIFTLISGIAGNSIIRYGKNAYWVYYVLLLLVTFGSPRLLHLLPGAMDVVASGIDMVVSPAYSQGGIWMKIIIFIVLTLIINWLTTRKVAVNNDL